MKLISWNVNGLRACLNKGFAQVFSLFDSDLFCLQETKLQPHQLDLSFPGYEFYLNPAEKKGYSGTGIFTRIPPLSVSYGIGFPELDKEGRVITMEFCDFWVVNCYAPNAQQELVRLPVRMEWETRFLEYIQQLDAKKPVVLCGDLNVAHREIDLKNPKSNRGSAGFSDEERQKMTELLGAGFTDTFRYKNGDIPGAYTWWSYLFRARENNAGWRIDYFIVSDRLRSHIVSSSIYPEVTGSDHCPVGLILE